MPQQKKYLSAVICALFLCGSASLAGTKKPVTCEAASGGVSLIFPITHSAGQPLNGDISVNGAATSSPNEVLSIPMRQVVGYWSDDGAFQVKALDSMMKDRILELRTKKGKGTLYLRVGKVLLDNAKVNCELDLPNAVSNTTSSP